MSADKTRPPPYRLTFSSELPADLIALRNVDPAALDAAQAIVDDLAHRRVCGKLLGERRVSGDLTGLARAKFDIAARRPQRFRLLYQQVDEDTCHVVAIGVHDEHAIYRAAVRRVTRA